MVFHQSIGTLNVHKFILNTCNIDYLLPIFSVSLSQSVVFCSLVLIGFSLSPSVCVSAYMNFCKWFDDVAESMLLFLSCTDVVDVTQFSTDIFRKQFKHLRSLTSAARMLKTNQFLTFPFGVMCTLDRTASKYFQHNTISKIIYVHICVFVWLCDHYK